MISKRGGLSNTAIIGVVVVVIIVIAGVSLIVLPSLSPQATHSSQSSSIASSTSGQSSQASLSTSSATSSTSVGKTTTLVCPTSTTSQTLNLAPLFGNFTKMSGYLYQLRGQQATTVDSNYTVLYTNSTMFKVSISSNATGASVATTAWMSRNGTVVSLSQAGYNYTGSQAEKLMLQSMDPFILEVSQESITPTPAEIGATALNQSVVTIGSANVTVTNYATNELPVTLTQCSTTQTVTKFVFQTGSVEGTTFPLLTVFDVGAYQMVSGQPYTLEVVFRLTSVTV